MSKTIEYEVCTSLVRSTMGGIIYYWSAWRNREESTFLHSIIFCVISFFKMIFLLLEKLPLSDLVCLRLVLWILSTALMLLFPCCSFCWLFFGVAVPINVDSERFFLFIFLSLTYSLPFSGSSKIFMIYLVSRVLSILPSLNICRSCPNLY